MAAYFSPAALRFIRALRRNNDRVWFAERLDVYRREVQEPMTRLCEDVNVHLTDFAPMHVKPAHKAMMRIYANVRFHPDKPPLKTHLGAWWGVNGAEKTSGAGFYLHFGATEFEVAAGCFMPTPDQLHRVREAIARDPKPIQKLLDSQKLRKLFEGRVCDSLKRAPRGFSETDPAIDLLRCVRWGVYTAMSPEVATREDLLSEVITRFRVMAPMVDYLNQGIGTVAKPFDHR